MKDRLNACLMRISSLSGCKPSGGSYEKTLASLAIERGLMCRYWLADTYEERHAQSQEPQNVDKEFLRLWFRQNCDPYNDKVSSAASCCCRVMRRGPLHRQEAQRHGALGVNRELRVLNAAACRVLPSHAAMWCLSLRACLVSFCVGSGDCNFKGLISRLLLQVLPEAPMELITELARRYVLLYEKITGRDFEIPGFGYDPQSKMAARVTAALKTSGKCNGQH